MVDDAEPIIYVVDDDEAVRDSLKLLLESHGMVVEDYRSSEEFARGYVPGRRGCLILDLHLPGGQRPRLSRQARRSGSRFAGYRNHRAWRSGNQSTRRATGRARLPR